MSQPPPTQAPNMANSLSLVFLAHILTELPLCVISLIAGHVLPFYQMTNTTLLILKLYAALSLGMCLAAFLVIPLPDFLPGKRAFAMGLLVYHSICSTALWHTPRFIPFSLGPQFEMWHITAEMLWGGLHAMMTVLLALWYQITLGQRPEHAPLKKE